MRFTPTTIQGAVIVEADPREDERGFFARLHCPVEFAAAGISFTPLQASLSRNTAALTLRGMHYATEPEAKLVRCVRDACEACWSHEDAIDARSIAVRRAFGAPLRVRC